MKIKLLIACFTTAVLACALPCRANTTNPVIFNITPSIKAGQVLGIQGANFGTNPQVWVDRIVDGSDVPDLETQITNVVTKSDVYVAAECPATMQEGLYAIFVKNTTTGMVSAYKFVNQASVTQALDLAGTDIDASRTFRLAGKSLDFAGSTSTVKFKKVSDGTTLDATVTQGSDPYLLTVQSPAGLVAGENYDLLVSNGYGGTYGEVTTVRLKARAGGTDFWGLNVPWAADFNFYSNVYNVKTDSRLTTHAVGDGVTNDSAAIQAALNKASADGGGVVYLPGPATYLIAVNPLKFQSLNRVVLQGDGIDVTRVFCDSAVATDNCLFAGRAQTNTMSYVGFSDLTGECGVNGPSDVFMVGGSGKEMFVARCKFITNKHGGISAAGTNNMVIQDSYVIQNDSNSGGSVLGFCKTDTLVRNNYLQWHDGRLDLYSNGSASNVRFQFENNLCRRSINRTQFGGNQSGGMSLGGAQTVAILNNTFNRLETGTSTPLPKSNDGETIMDESIQFKVLSVATSSTDTTLVDSTKSWASSFTGWRVTIIQGPGIGQIRNIVSNTANTITIDQPWDVNPTAQSYYCVSYFDSNWLIKGNLLQEVPRGIWACYGGSMDNVSIVGNSLIDTNGIYLRGDTRPVSQPGRFNVQRDILIEGNTVTNTRNWYTAQIVVTQTAVDGSQLYGNPFYDVVVRGNVVTGQGFSGPSSDDGTGCGEGYYARQHGITDNDTIGVLGTIFDSNTANNVPYAYHVNSGSSQNVIWNGIYNNVDLALADGTMTGATHPSMDTVVGPGSPYAPDIIVDNSDSTGVTTTGSWTTSASGTSAGDGFYGVNYVNDGNAGKGTKTIRFTPTIPSSGVYQVYARWIAGTNRATNVPFAVTNAAGTDNQSINQQVNGAQWVLIGTYSFDAGTTGNVLISNTGTSGYVMADAVRFKMLAAVPTGLSATAGNAQVVLNWNASSGATSYNVKRATVSGGPYTTIANVTGTTYTDTSVTNGTSYYYVISAVNGSESANSSEVGAAPSLPPPSAPTGLAATAGDAQVALSWTASSGASGYNVKRATTTGGPYTTISSPAGTSYTDTTPTNGTTYYYVVSATNGAGESPNSAQASATPVASIVTMDNTDSTGVTITGAWTASSFNTGQFYGTNYLHDGNTGKGTKTVRYTPNIPSTGTYQVYMMWNVNTGSTDRATNVPVAVTHASGTANLTVNMRLTPGTWVLVGTYTFNAGTGGNLLISNTGTNGYVIADGVRFVKQ